MALVYNETSRDLLIHDRIVTEVAETRFGLDMWEVSTNLQSDSSERDVVVPDIVASNSKQVVAIGEVETFDTITKEQAMKWKCLGEVCSRFYLYVPEGTQDETARLVAEFDVACAGIRVYSYDERLEVRPVHVPVRTREDDHSWWLKLGRERAC